MDELYEELNDKVIRLGEKTDTSWEQVIFWILVGLAFAKLSTILIGF